MRLINAGAIVLMMAAIPAGAETVDPLVQLKQASELVGEIQACIANGLGGSVPQADLDAERTLMLASDHLARLGWVEAQKKTRTPQEDLLLRAYAKGALAMISEADDYRLALGY